MRRKTRLGLAILVPLLVLVGLYTGYWFIVADRLRQGVADWSQAVRPQGIDATWRHAAVGGFPFVFRVELDDARISDSKLSPAPELRIARLAASTLPWDFRHWQLSAPKGVVGELAGAGQRPPLKLAADAASGDVAVDGEGHASIWLGLTKLQAEAGDSVMAQSADCWVVLPPRTPQSHTDRNLGLAVDLHQVKLPLVPSPFSDSVEELAVGATLKGPLPGGPLRQAVTAWRDGGGTVELDNLHIAWGQLGVTATGTLALDRDLQPTGAFSGAVQGYDQVIGALVASGRIHGDMGLARMGLAMLAKAGPNGRPEIRTSFSIQNGEMRLGPIKLGPAPKIRWE